MKAFLDTHIAVALYRNHDDELSSQARDTLERSALVVSPMVALEMRFLHAIGRIRVTDTVLLHWLAEWRGVRRSHDDLHDLVETARAVMWTRDPFDLLIVATAMHHRAPLVTLDAAMREHYPLAIG